MTFRTAFVGLCALGVACCLATADDKIQFCEAASKTLGTTVVPRHENFPRIYEGFLFNDEVDMLEIHMRELARTVDYFIIVESELTFTNHEKRLVFADVRHKFADMEDQIIYILMNTSRDANPWVNENAQRQAIFQAGLHSEKAPVREGDIVIVTDIDEIVRPSILQALKMCTGYDGRRIRFFMDLYYYAFTSRNTKRDFWEHPDATIYSASNEPDAQEMRNGGDQRFSLIIRNAGWHCSWCFATLQRFRTKLTSYSHNDLSTAQFHSKEHIVNVVRHSLDVYNRNQPFEFVEAEDIPLYLSMNADRFEYMLDRRGPTALFKDIYE